MLSASLCAAARTAVPCVQSVSAAAAGGAVRTHSCTLLQPASNSSPASDPAYVRRSPVSRVDTRVMLRCAERTAVVDVPNATNQEP
jgi:hypothetical protein